jgi:hypothetical protein
MTATVWLRIASVIAVINAAFHTIGLLTPPRDPEANAAVLAMQAHQFNAMGSMRTFWDFYFGFSLSITVSLLLVAMLCWQLGDLAKVDAGRARPLIGSVCLATCSFAILSVIYLFAAPTVTISAISACVLGAWIVSRSNNAKQQ